MERRRFIKTGITSMAGIALGEHVVSAKPKQQRFIFSLHSIQLQAKDRNGSLAFDNMWIACAYTPGIKEPVIGDPVWVQDHSEGGQKEEYIIIKIEDTDCRLLREDRYLENEYYIIGRRR